MNDGEAGQGQFDFGSLLPRERLDGVARWHAERERARETVARVHGIAIGRRCRVTLTDGVELEGVLELQDERIFPTADRDPELGLRLGRCTFRLSEVVAVVRLD